MRTLYEGSEPYLFISYAHKDTDIVMPVIDYLQEQGFRIWFDEGIEAGMDWSDNIASHLINSVAVVSCITANYIDSNNCLDELSLGLDQKKKQLILYLDDISLPIGIQMRISRIQHIEKQKFSYEEFLDKLSMTPCIQDALNQVHEVKDDQQNDISVDSDILCPLKKMDIVEWSKYDLLSLDDIGTLSECTFDGKKWKKNNDGVKIPIGFAYDRNEGQVYPVIIDMMAMRGVYITGASGTGKTTLLETMSIALARKYNPSQLNIYVLSLSNKVLRCLSPLPHIGDIFYENEKDDIIRFIEMLKKEHLQRTNQFDSVNAYDFKEYNMICRRNGMDEMPAIAVLIDDWNKFIGLIQDEEYNYMCISSSVGIYFIVTVNDTIPGCYSRSFRGIYNTLFQIDLLSGSFTKDNVETLKKYGIPIGVRIPGRATTHIGEMLMEMRCAIPFRSMYGVERSEQIYDLGKKMNGVWHGEKVRKIMRIPENPSFDDFSKTNGFISCIEQPLSLPLAYDVTTGDAHILNLFTTWSYLIIGRKDSGKTNALMCIAKAFAKKGAMVLVAGGGNEEWNPLINEIGAIKIDPTTDEFSQFLSGTFVEEYIKPRVAKKKEGKIRGKSKEVAEQFAPVVLIFDGLEKFMDYPSFMNVAKLLGVIFTDAVGCGIYTFLSLQCELCKQKERNLNYEIPIKGLMRQNRYIVMGGLRDSASSPDMPFSFQTERKFYSLPLHNGVVYDDYETKQIQFPQMGSQNETES